jgi:hypothetical protein
LRSIEKAANLAIHGRAKGFVVTRVVHVGKWVVLPDEDSELVTRVVKRIGLVEEWATYPHHVHPGSTHCLERFAVRGVRARQCGRVEWSPTGSTAEDVCIIHANAEAVIGIAPGERSESNATQVDAHLAIRTEDLNANRVTGWRAVSVRPPSLDASDSERAARDDLGAAVARPPRKRLGGVPHVDDRATWDPAIDRVELYLDIDHAVVAVRPHA